MPWRLRKQTPAVEAQRRTAAVQGTPRMVRREG